MFTVGPIIFCKKCGATKSHSSGTSLARPCRRWAPPGTQGLIKSFLKGKAPNKFYREVLRNATLPVKRLRTKTRPTPKLVIPSHLIQPNSPTNTPSRPPIRITTHTVLQGSVFQLPTTGVHHNADPSPTTSPSTPESHPPEGSPTQARVPSLPCRPPSPPFPPPTPPPTAPTRTPQSTAATLDQFDDTTTCEAEPALLQYGGSASAVRHAL
jgi:hypothetical protein